MILEEATKEAFRYYARDLKPQSDKLIIAACELCGKFRITSKRHYCTFCGSCIQKGRKHSEKTKALLSASAKLRTGDKASNWQGGPVKCICLQCDKEFERQPSEIKRGWGKYCSLSCAAKARTGDKCSNWRGGPIKCICAFCGKEFEVGQSVIKHGNGKYCSVSCARKARIGNKASNWQGGPVKCICLQCDKEFERQPSEIKRGWGKYCSLSCAAKAKRYNARPVMTAPEKAFQAICIKNNLPFKFVGNGSLWLGNANPDFVHNTKKIVVEVFGDYWHSPLLRPNLRDNETVEGRTEQLKVEGYKCIVIWESDLMREDAEKFIMHTLYTEGVI